MCGPAGMAERVREGFDDCLGGCISDEEGGEDQAVDAFAPTVLPAHGQDGVGHVCAVRVADDHREGAERNKSCNLRKRGR